MKLTEEERLEAAAKAISTALEMFGVCFAWEYDVDGEFWLEIDDENPPKPPKPKFTVVQ